MADSQPPSGNEPRPFYDFLESCLRHKSGARALARLPAAALPAHQATPAHLFRPLAAACPCTHRARLLVSRCVLSRAPPPAAPHWPPYSAEMVIFEAARAICNMRDVSSRELTPAVTVLQLFLSSSKPVLRFAAVRTLNKVRGGRGALHC